MLLMMRLFLWQQRRLLLPLSLSLTLAAASSVGRRQLDMRECCWLENGILGRVKAAAAAATRPAVDVCFCLPAINGGKLHTFAAHLCFYVHVWDHDENWRIKSTQPPSTKVSQRMTAFFSSYIVPPPQLGWDVVVSLDPSSGTGSSSWGVGSITWPPSVCHVQHLAFIVTLHEFLVGDQKIQLLCFLSLLLLSPFLSFHTHTQKVQYQMATSVEHEIMSMSRVARGTE